MYKTTASISGMVCGMCEAHINNAIRSAFPVKKVTSSRSKGETVILSDQPLSQDLLRETINSTGYILLSINEEQCEKQSLFGRLLKHQD